MKFSYDIKLEFGNSFNLIKFLTVRTVDLILTDIPYKISRNTNFKTMKTRKNRTGLDFGQWDHNFNINKLIPLQDLLKPSGSLILFHSFEQYEKLKSIFKKLTFKDKFIWEKTNPMPRNRDRRYISNIELGSWFVKGDGWTFNRLDKYQSSVFRFPSESGGGFKRYHPTQKNVELIKKLILIHSNENDLVLDPFMGGGTTGIACIRTKRRFLGMENNLDYFKIAKERIDLEIDKNEKEGNFL